MPGSSPGMTLRVTSAVGHRQNADQGDPLMPHEPGVARPASTILLLRRGAADPIDVFMMVRHYQIEFASGALVFPGGSVDAGDRDIIARPELYAGGPGLDAEALAFRIAA